MRTSSVLILAALALSFGIGTVHGASFPTKPITFVVPSGPGSGIDIAARYVAEVFEKYKLLSQPIVVEDKPGGSHAVALAYVAGKKKDPYFILGSTASTLFTPLLGNSPFNYKDFTCIANLSLDDFILMVNAGSKYKSIKDLVDYAKAHPETVTIGGSMVGGPESVNTYRLEKGAGIKLKYVGFGSGGDAITALLGGHIDMASGNPTEIMELVRSNKVRILGILTEKRLSFLPDVPTIKEQGVNVVGLGMWRGVLAPGGIPEDARKVLEEAFSKFSKTAEYKKFHEDNMLTQAYLNGNDFRKFLDQKNDEFSAILKDIGLLKPMK
jgi:putative tricarboxylic transport membrane protein